MKSFKLCELELGRGPGGHGMPQGSSAGDDILRRQQLEQLHIWFYTLDNPTPKGEKVNPQIAKKIADAIGVPIQKMAEVGEKMKNKDRKTCELVFDKFVNSKFAKGGTPVEWDKKHPVNDARGEGKKKVMQKKFIPKG